jgi:phosphate transport system protein
MTEHISRQFDTEMEALRTGVLSMGGLVEKQFQRALIALGESDEDILDAVARDEQAINQAQMTIDHQYELERIGDELKKIAHKGPALRGHERLAQVRLHEIPRVAGIARDMLQMSLDAFARLDAAESADIVGLDAKVDAAFKAITRQLVSYMMEDPRTITAALEILFIAKWLERIGDHAKNIAEHVVQAAKGKDVRHASVEQIRMELNE